MKIEDIKEMIKIKEKQEKRLNECKKMLENRFVEDENMIMIIESEIQRLEKELGMSSKKFKYSAEDIAAAGDVDMLIEGVLPLSAIIVIVGTYGQGKSTLIRHLLFILLEQNESVIVKYVEADNPVKNLNKSKLHEEIDRFQGRLEVHGDSSDCLDMHICYIDMLKETIKLQKANKEKRYIVVVDNLKNIAKKNKYGLIDSNELFVYEKKFRSVGGTTIISHHTNKKGISADTQDINNFCDASFNLHYNQTINTIIIQPDKQSRFHIKPKAFLVNPETRRIISEVEYNGAILPDSEKLIIEHVVELLTYVDEFNQDQLVKETTKFRNKLAMGEKRFRAILHKYSDIHWATIRSRKNSLIFSSLDKKLPNCQTIQGDGHEK